MLDDIKKFYEKTKLDQAYPDDTNEPPITHTHVFHKSYPRLPSIELPRVEPLSEFEALLQMRESCRNFSPESLRLADLSYILSSCRIVDNSRDPERRTYPSAGARFPIEIYLVSFNIAGLTSGAYHYNMQNQSLELLWDKDLHEYEKEIVSPYLSNTALALIFTSVISRAEVKYGAKAYPYSLIEAGHMAQNVQLACTKRNLGSCPIGGFINNRVSQILDVTEDEIPIYVIGIGKRCPNEEI